jgi:outer membrane protein OmpA-like peptidoglycan-associated protein
MHRHETAILSRGPAGFSLKALIFISVILPGFRTSLHAQEIERTQPVWWFGGAAAANLNFYSGTTQVLNSALTTPAAFHKGFGTGLYLAPLVEYRHDRIWGGMLQVGYDDRRGSFDDVICPCGEIATLSAKVSYISIEPNLRIAPFSGDFYLFAGPRVGFNWAPNIPKSSTKDEKSFVYAQAGQPATQGEFSSMRKTVFSGQIGMGYDIPLSSPHNRTQVDLSPFISFQPYFGQGPRSVESWAVSTLRMGAAIKFGRGKVISRTEREIPACAEVQFSVRAPKAVPVKRRVRETFPLRNYVFFEEGATDVPVRYVALTKDQAANFKEEQLQEVQPKNMTGRSLRQMAVYYNVLNIIGDRMKRNPGTAISLSGASEKGPEHGKARAESVKRYLVDVFGIDGSRITTEGRDKPRNPSEQPGATKELDLLRAGDRRVDIESNSSEIAIQVGGGSHYMLKPVQIVAEVEDPLDSHVLFDAVGSKDALTSWSMEITDDQGKIQPYGPFTRERETIPGNTLLAGRSQGDYKIVQTGQRKDGQVVRKESSVHLVRRDTPAKEEVRFSILFDFDKSKTVDSYEKFLTNIVTPLIPDSGTVVIHGYTDVIGEEAYNENLSKERVQDTRGILEHALSNSGKSGIIFETFGFGEDPQYMPFDNNLPEERSYNRTVIIDIVPD